MSITVPVFTRQQCQALGSLIDSQYNLHEGLSQNSMCIANTTHGGQLTCQVTMQPAVSLLYMFVRLLESI